MEELLKKHRWLVVLRHDEKDKALKAARVCLQSGVEIVEVTLTTPGAMEILVHLKEEFPDKAIGVGSVTEIDQLLEASKLGADFFVSPHFNEALSQAAKENALFYVPGGMTPSELMNIQLAGHSVQKLFPAQVLGASGVKGILKPLPKLNLMVTGGVKRENAGEFLKAGAICVCVGGELLKSQWLLEENWELLEAEVKGWIHAVG